jgi:hypothetical protein
MPYPRINTVAISVIDQLKYIFMFSSMNRSDNAIMCGRSISNQGLNQEKFSAILQQKVKHINNWQEIVNERMMYL